MSTTRRVSAFDGIRGLGCTAVIASHLHPNGPLAAGWISPDMFFVLSGFLITALLLREREHTGRIRLGRMWGRRAARLYPALIVTVVLSAALPIGLTWGEIGRALLYVTDLRPDVDTVSPLAHTWSLGVQEQFYVLWPIVVVLVRSRRALATCAAAAIVASLATMVSLAGPGLSLEGSPAYYAPSARMWELLTGSLLAVLLPRGLPSTPAGHVLRRRLVWGATVGMAVTLATAVAFPGQWMVHSVATVVCVGAVLVAVGGPGSRPDPGAPALPVRWLTWRPLVWLGERSYGAYLFHVPLMLAVPGLSWARHGLGTVIVVAGVLVLSAASYRWIEIPLRDLAARPSRRSEPAPHAAETNAARGAGEVGSGHTNARRLAGVARRRAPGTAPRRTRRRGQVR